MVKVLLLNVLTSMYGTIKVDLKIISTHMKYIQYTLTRFHVQRTAGSIIFGLWIGILVSLKLKCLDGFVSYKHCFLSSQDINWWTGVVWIIVMFLSDSHSDGTHSLQSIHWWDTDEMLHFSKSDEETNSSGLPEGDDILCKFPFWVEVNKD